ncbi:hypothetical protein CHS0354_010695 [Potamilus streckersoni]|uniref:Uncharacterized protein n=1 Tax=Potamilus streckersoni TaxID=2493646 RepID=A0AAE0TC44_9BIVA|nr:hypothetical protein CHS0354_010695 [Potamilus streckersoni]
MAHCDTDRRGMTDYDADRRGMTDYDADKFTQEFFCISHKDHMAHYDTCTDSMGMAHYDTCTDSMGMAHYVSERRGMTDYDADRRGMTDYDADKFEQGSFCISHKDRMVHYDTCTDSMGMAHYDTCTDSMEQPILDGDKSFPRKDLRSNQYSQATNENQHPVQTGDQHPVLTGNLCPIMTGNQVFCHDRHPTLCHNK